MNNSIIHDFTFADPTIQLEYARDPMAFNKSLTEPRFRGQGCSHGVGSDCYGYYIVDRKILPNKKVIWGLSRAKTKMRTTWEEGTQDCLGPVSWKADEWIIARGKVHRYGKTLDRPQFWFCDENGEKRCGKCTYGFGGAYAYQNPSF